MLLESSSLDVRCTRQKNRRCMQRIATHFATRHATNTCPPQRYQILITAWNDQVIVYMRLIFSRKGFDSQYGEVPSPILPNGQMISLPIPSSTVRTTQSMWLRSHPSSTLFCASDCIWTIRMFKIVTTTRFLRVLADWPYRINPFVHGCKQGLKSA